MSVLSQALALTRVQREEPSWRLLRADLSPVVVALLAEHLGGEERRLDAEEFYERVDADLDELRAHGYELPGSARGYAAQWRTDDYLVRRPAESSRGETFELSPAVHEAIRFLTQLASPRQTVTESRLTSIIGQLQQLAIDSDPDTTRRLQQLHAQRDRLDAQIEAVARGELPVVDQNRAIERVQDIIAQAEDIPTDFARVRARFEDLNRDLRNRVIESDAAQSTVLGEIFRGVDLIGESDAGRSFSGFSALVLDPEIAEALDSDIRMILERDFAGQLAAPQRRFLRRMRRDLKDRSSEIHEVITTFARGLRRYVQTQEYQRDRMLRLELRAALAEGLGASEHTKPYRPTALSLDLAAVKLTSAGSLRMHDPSEFDASEPVQQHAAAVDFEELLRIARETEIDFSELTANVNAALGRVPEASVGEILSQFPATQGVASVVGLLALAATHGDEIEAHSEQVHWDGEDGISRWARIPMLRFTRRVL